jgi:hypothetical protein
MKRHIHVAYKNGTGYAEIYTPQRKDGKKINNSVYLGKVIDLEKGIFHNQCQQFKVFHQEITFQL